MSQHRAISQLLSLGQESFEDEIRRLVSILIYNFFYCIVIISIQNFFLKIDLNLKYFALGY